MAVPSPSNKVEFQEYGEEYINTLAGHYFTGNETDDEEVLAAKMRVEWGKLKFDLHEWKAKVPKDVKDGKHLPKLLQLRGHCSIFYNNHLIDFSIPC